jgi:hypothetical protein
MNSTPRSVELNQFYTELISALQARYDKILPRCVYYLYLVNIGNLGVINIGKIGNVDKNAYRSSIMLGFKVVFILKSANVCTALPARFPRARSQLGPIDNRSSSNQ